MISKIMSYFNGKDENDNNVVNNCNVELKGKQVMRKNNKLS